MAKIVLVSSLQPDTNYSQFLCRDLSKEVDTLIVYSDKNPRNKKIVGCGDVKLVWDKNLLFIPQIIGQLTKDKPDIIHIQHEINMYGNLMTSVAFPILLILTRLTGVKVVTTVHAIVDPKSVDKSFVSLFKGQDSKIPPFVLKIFFSYLYKSIGIFSNKIIVHTNILKDVLVNSYGISEDRVLVVAHGVPKLQLEDIRNDKYILYFGYIVKRKGLENIVGGFKKFLSKNKNSDFKLVLAGGVIKGQDFASNELKKFVKDSDLENKVVFTGFLDGKEIDKYFRYAYVIAIPSVISIAASGPFALAISYGKCVLASDIGNFKEEISDGVDGILVKDNKWEEAFSEITKDLDKLKRIEGNVLKKAKNRHWSKIAKIHSDIYNQVLKP
jgi:glycosyltransferase involved in cell wall biosynthesis